MQKKVQIEEKNQRSTKVFRIIRKERNICHPRKVGRTWWREAWLIPNHSKMHRIIAISAKICLYVKQFVYRCWTKYINQFISNRFREKFWKVKQKRPCLWVWEELSSLSSFISKYAWRYGFTGGNFNETKLNCVCVQRTACVRFMLDTPGLCSADVRSVRRVWIY